MFGRNIRKCNATGGGAYKYAGLVKEELSMEYVQRDEMGSLVLGLNFLFTLKTEQPPIFCYDDHKQIPVKFDTTDILFPYLLVSCGSGVSIILVEGKRKFKRVSGSAIGGGTFAGLCRLIVENSKTYEEIIECAKGGDHTNVDLLVGDIYGGDYVGHGLKADIIASTFGRVATLKVPEGKKLTDCFSKADAIKSLLFMMANHLAQLAYLCSHKHRAKNIFFSGGFIRNNHHVWSKLSYAMNYFTEGKRKAMFVRHDGFLGALGAFIQK